MLCVRYYEVETFNGAEFDDGPHQLYLADEAGWKAANAEFDCLRDQFAAGGGLEIDQPQTRMQWLVTGLKDNHRIVLFASGGGIRLTDALDPLREGDPKPDDSSLLVFIRD